MDLLFIWWGVTWLGQWFFSTHLQSAALTCLWLAVLWLVLLWGLKKNGQLRDYGLCTGKTADLCAHKIVPVALCALPAANLALVMIHGPCVSGAASLPFLLLLAVFASVTEEFLFRGLLLRWFCSALHRKAGTAVVLSALLFAAFHFQNGGAAGYLVCRMLCAFTVGLCAGAMTLKAESLLPAMLLHIFINITGEFVPPGVSWLQAALFIGSAAVYLIIGICFLKQLSKEGHY